jgi:hypothetical protein
MRWNIRNFRYTFRGNAPRRDISQCHLRKKYEKVEEKKEENSKKKEKRWKKKGN